AIGGNGSGSGARRARKRGSGQLRRSLPLAGDRGPATLAPGSHDSARVIRQADNGPGLEPSMRMRQEGGLMASQNRSRDEFVRGQRTGHSRRSVLAGGAAALASSALPAPAPAGGVDAERTRPHQPGQAAFKTILAEDIDWRSFPAFPSSVRLAVLVGQPSEPGPYAIRVKVPRGVKLMPHRHPEDRVYTVISGVFYIGLGDQFDPDRLQAYAPGTVVVLPGDTSHFHWAKDGEGVPRVTAIGPLGLEYVTPRDDPRNASSGP